MRMEHAIVSPRLRSTDTAQEPLFKLEQGRVIVATLIFHLGCPVIGLAAALLSLAKGGSSAGLASIR